jgi:hypothetical protein
MNPSNQEGETMATYRYYILKPIIDGVAGPLCIDGWARPEEFAKSRTKPGGKVVYASNRGMALQRATTTGPVLYSRPGK